MFFDLKQDGHFHFFHPKPIGGNIHFPDFEKLRHFCRAFRIFSIFQIQRNMNFKSLLCLFFTLLFGASFFSEKTFSQCQFRLEMYDSQSDGWLDGVLTIESGTSVYKFSLNNLDDDGLDSTIFFAVQHKQPLKISWQQPFFANGEISFEIFDADGALVFEAADPADGLLFSGNAKCPACLEPADFRVENIWDNRVRLRWNPLITDSIPKGWWVIYGETGFSPAPGEGDTMYVTQPKATVLGLKEMTGYDVFLRQDCGNGATTDLVGPLSIKTYWSDDVGISGVVTPVSGCGLGDEIVTVLIANFGANPQSLLPFYYSVNGVPKTIPYPMDGLFTAVLGKDSAKVIPFETQHDFSAPGEYVIQVWTEMSNDDFTANDTFTYRITNSLQVPYNQDFETWSGSWTVDTAGQNQSWEFGKPAGQIINKAANGENAWVTNLTGNYKNEEDSYLTSPCFDFSNLTEDPAIQFSIFLNIEEKYDGAWLEASTDDGQNWVKIGAQNEGLRWYNDRDTSQTFGDWWSGNSAGWVTARHTLNGLATKKEARVRFVFHSDELTNFEGVGVDDIQILKRAARDLAGESVHSLTDFDACGLQNDSLTFRFVNVGTAVQNSFSVVYRVNNSPVVAELIQNADLAPDEIFEYKFKKPFDSRDQLFNIRAWTILTSDANKPNDTARVSFDHRALPVPVFENFESGVLPIDWFTNGNGAVLDDHNNQSFVFAANLFEFSQNFSLTSTRHGLVTAGDSLFFDYRITNYQAGTVATVLEGNTQFLVEISDDCGQNFQTIYTIDKSNHTPAVGLTKVKIDLSQFAGHAVVLRFQGFRTAGDFWFDLDNINIRTCPADMLLSADVSDAALNLKNGKATVNVGLGNPPFKYNWSNGAMTQTASGLDVGTYFVTVTDSKGCSSVLEIQVGLSGSTDLAGLSVAKLQPNPTTGFSNLILKFENSMDANVQIINAFGQILDEIFIQNQTETNLPLDVRTQPNGLYFVKIRANGGVKTLRWMKI